MFSCEHWLILALSKVTLTLLGDVFLWTLAHFGTFKSYIDIVGWCFPVNVGSFWHFQKLCWHCWVMFSECFLVNVGSFWHFQKLCWHCWVMFSECFLVNVGSFWHFQKLCWHCWVMFSCERWLILALSKVMLTLLGDVFLWTLAHVGTFKSYVDIVGWCFPVNVGSFWHF